MYVKHIKRERGGQTSVLRHIYTQRRCSHSCVYDKQQKENTIYYNHLDALFIVRRLSLRLFLNISELKILSYMSLLSDRRFVTRMTSLQVFLYFCVGHRHTNQKLLSRKSSLERILKKSQIFIIFSFILHKEFFYLV